MMIYYRSLAFAVVIIFHAVGIASLHASLSTWTFAPSKAGRVLQEGGWTVEYSLGQINASPEFSFPLQLIYRNNREQAGMFCAPIRSISCSISASGKSRLAFLRPSQLTHKQTTKTTMKLKPILTACAVALAALAQPALAESVFTQNEKGEVTHVKGIPLPPIQTVEEARAQAQKEIAAAKTAREAEQAQRCATRNASPGTHPQEVFYTGKPYLEETGQYLFLFRHYDPELARWTTADPSGFPNPSSAVLS